METREIKRLLAVLEAADVSEFSLETAEYKLALKRGALAVSAVTAQPSAAPAAGAAAPTAPPVATVAATTDTAAEPGEAPPASKAIEVTAPIVGTFYAAPSPDAPPYVRVGDRVKPGTVLCIIEAMKLMNEIEAEFAGVVREVLVNNDDPVEYGQALFRIEPD